MNHFIWIGIIMWGVLVTGFGFLSMPEPGSTIESGMEAHSLLFLLAGGLISCLIGIVGLLGVMGWMPGLRGDKESA